MTTTTQGLAAECPSSQLIETGIKLLLLFNLNRGNCRIRPSRRGFARAIRVHAEPKFLIFADAFHIIESMMLALARTRVILLTPATLSW